MSTLPEPLSSTFPNLIEALEENMPLLCTILVGFEGLAFVTVAASHDPFPEVALLAFPLISFRFNARPFIMTTSGSSCLLLYFSVMFMVYSRMSRYKHLLTKAEIVLFVERDRELQLVVEKAIRSLDSRRFVCAISCMFTFNTAITLIPISVLIFAPTLIFSVGVDLLIVSWVVSVYFLVRTARSPRIPWEYSRFKEEGR